MLKEKIALLMSCLVHTPLKATTLAVFVSFSMPDTFLKETLHESSRLHIPVYLNGLYHDSMIDTADKILSLSKQVPNLNLQIDPTLFERFNIRQVPALVVYDGKAFDVIYGHLPLKEGLLRMAGRGESGFSLTDAKRVRGD
ncbi:type-F conjugative transfer system pilin assembly protein TrbC [Legionella gresilensis]|uniref:type-F conjugative transfer system pilin assembly protein TrbC n=1 Tax=Legionella gresilensis TaxID=91823 RepID=UPI001040F116|nr:type-F conjugative transfer system pilin assembly protein TrbC [Legionella gresilensis]